MTKCKFFRQTHYPLVAACLIVSIAISFYPPPIAISWYPALPTTYSANSCSSALGSEPGDIINRMGSEGADSISNRCAKAKGAGYIVYPPNASLTKLCIADSSRSGLKTYIIMHLWNGVTLETICWGNSFSGWFDFMKGYQIPSFSRDKLPIIFEKVFANIAKISFLSFVAHLGSCIWESELATTLPEKNSHSFLPNSKGYTPLIKWRLYVRRSDLNKDLPISEKLNLIRLLERWLSFSSIELA